MGDSKQRKAFKEFVKKSKQELGDSLIKTILFGSVAKDLEKENSDVDILAVLKNPEDKEELHRIAFDIEIKYDVLISLIPKTKEEYEKTKNTQFRKEIEKGETIA